MIDADHLDEHGPKLLAQIAEGMTVWVTGQHPQTRALELSTFGLPAGGVETLHACIDLGYLTTGEGRELVLTDEGKAALQGVQDPS